MPVKYIPVKLSTLPVDADRACVDWQCRLCTTKLISSARVHGLYIATASAEDRTVHSNIVTAVGGVMNLMERIGGGAVRDMMDDAKEAGMRMVDDKHGVIAYQYTVVGNAGPCDEEEYVDHGEKVRLCNGDIIKVQTGKGVGLRVCMLCFMMPEGEEDLTRAGLVVKMTRTASGSVLVCAYDSFDKVSTDMGSYTDKPPSSMDGAAHVHLQCSESDRKRWFSFTSWVFSSRTRGGAESSASASSLPSGDGGGGAAEASEAADEDVEGGNKKEAFISDCDKTRHVKGKKTTVLADFAIHKMTACYTSADRTTSAMRGTMCEYVGSFGLNKEGRGSVFMDGDVGMDEILGKKIGFFKVTLEPAKLTFESFSTALAPIWANLGAGIKGKTAVENLRTHLSNLSNYQENQVMPDTAIYSFGVQPATSSRYRDFVYKNATLRVTTGDSECHRSVRIMTHTDTKYRVVRDLLAHKSLSESFQPNICPVGCTIVRLRFFRTLMHVIGAFTGVNREAAMFCMSVYAAAFRFEDIQRSFPGFPITLLTSPEGSTGKTEVVRMMQSIMGFSDKAMCASASEPGLYQMVGSVFASLPVCIDDLKWDSNRSGKLDETIKALYDGFHRVVQDKNQSNKSPVIMTSNLVPHPNDPPTQSRISLLFFRRISKFDAALGTRWRGMMPIASMLAQDFMALPLIPEYVRDCENYIGAVLVDAQSVATRTKTNWALMMYYRLLIQRFIPPSHGGWDSIFKYIATDVAHVAVSYSAEGSVMDKFVKYLSIAMEHNDRGDNRGKCISVHNMRTLTTAEVTNLNLPAIPREYVAFNISTLVHVVCAHAMVPVTVDDMQIAVLDTHLKDMSKICDSGVHRGSVAFCDMTELIRMQSGEGASIVDNDRVSEFTNVCDSIILDNKWLEATGSGDANESVVDFRRVEYDRDGNGVPFNLYDVVTAGSWGAFEALENHPLMKAASEIGGGGGVGGAEPWDDAAFERQQYNTIDEIAAWYRPDGKIVYPRTSDFMEMTLSAEEFRDGMHRVETNAKRRRESYETFLADDRKRRCKEITDSLGMDLEDEEDDDDAGASRVFGGRRNGAAVSDSESRVGDLGEEEAEDLEDFPNAVGSESSSAAPSVSSAGSM